ncbi:hypothetical protein CDL12_22451 [Handroanthus impetiginosus]|uniref:Uncharacterized protein n=1 Tax=Handroanthus impetiginosus TaxID=429701 RepID=A0A2G9GIA7_9LAMI|nr:hypothetical protein CDL12_22451 [Handroanthus impetiginosus]
MSNLTKLELTTLNKMDKSYLSWMLDTKIHLDAKGLGDAIIEGNKVSSQDKEKVMIFLCKHQHKGLKAEYWKVTGKDLPEETFSTFHALNMLLQQQYHEKCLSYYHCHSNSYGHGRGCGCNNYCYHNGTSYNSQRQKWRNNNEKGKDKGGQSNPSKDIENIYFQYDLKGHWSHTCRTPKYLVKFYQDSIKGKGKNVETNFTYHNNDSNYDVETNFAYKDDDFDGFDDIMHLDVADFFESHEERTRDENNI